MKETRLKFLPSTSYFSLIIRHIISSSSSTKKKYPFTQRGFVAIIIQFLLPISVDSIAQWARRRSRAIESFHMLSWVRHENRTHDLRGEKRLFWRIRTNQAMPTTTRHMIYFALNIPWEDKPCLCSNISYLRCPLSVSLPLRCPGRLPGLKTKKLASRLWNY
jgi:hypothetical protein